MLVNVTLSLKHLTLSECPCVLRSGAGSGADRPALRHRERQVRALDVARHGPQHRGPPLLGAMELVLLPRHLRRRLHLLVPPAARLRAALAEAEVRGGWWRDGSRAGPTMCTNNFADGSLNVTVLARSCSTPCWPPCWAPPPASSCSSRSTTRCTTSTRSTPRSPSSSCSRYSSPSPGLAATPSRPLWPPPRVRHGAFKIGKPGERRCVAGWPISTIPGVRMRGFQI